MEKKQHTKTVIPNDHTSVLGVIPWPSKTSRAVQLMLLSGFVLNEAISRGDKVKSVRSGPPTSEMSTLN